MRATSDALRHLLRMRLNKHIAETGQCSRREADRLVADALADLEKGRRVSVPSKRYKVLTGVARYTPSTVLGKLQRLGRR